MDRGELLELIRKAKESRVERNFKQSVELILALKDIDVRRQRLSINEVVFLPHKPGRDAKVCVIAGGDIALRPKRAGADTVIPPEELDRLATSKRDAKKLAKAHDFFLAEVSLMPKVGRALGPILGPRGKMPTPIPPNAPVEAMISRFKSAARFRTRGQLMVSGRIGSEDMGDEELADNALAVISAVEKKLPQGLRNVKKVMVKLTMSPVVGLKVSR